MSIIDEILNEESVFETPEPTNDYFDVGINRAKVVGISINPYDFIDVNLEKGEAKMKISFKFAKLSDEKKKSTENRINKIILKNILQLLKGSIEGFNDVKAKEFLQRLKIGDNSKLFQVMESYLKPAIAKGCSEIEVLVTYSTKREPNDNGYYWKEVKTSSFDGLTIYPSTAPTEWKLQEDGFTFSNQKGEHHPAFCRNEKFHQEGFLYKSRPDEVNTEESELTPSDTSKDETNLEDFDF